MKLIIVLLLFCNNLWAEEMEKAQEEARRLVNSLQGDVVKAASSANLNNVPGFQGSNPPEANLYDQHADGNLSEKAAQKLAGDNAGQAIINSAQTRKRFVIDPKTDPLFKAIDGYVIDDSLNINDEITKVDDDNVIKKICEEGGEDISYECLENRNIVPQVPLKTITIAVNHLPINSHTEAYEYIVKERSKAFGKKWVTRDKTATGTRTIYSITLPKNLLLFRKQFCDKFNQIDVNSKQIFNVDCNRIQSYKVNGQAPTQDSLTISFGTSRPSYLTFELIHDTYEGEGIEEWIGCEHFEKLVDEGLCQYGERNLNLGPETRNIHGYPIFRDEWQYKQIYHCKMVKNECDELRAQGCYQVGSNCKEWKQNKCWIYLQEYHCPSGKKVLLKVKSSKHNAFCLTGDCHDQSYTANGEMLDAIAKLSVLREVQQDLKTNSDFKIFKGDAYQCSRNCLNFKDCCGGMKGWGVSLKLTGCKPEEQQLAKMRNQNLCHQVGNTYCAKRDPVLKKCIKKKTSFCCFGTKFAKIIQEQGRPQLGIGWGNEKCPDCRALTIEELSRLDLSKMNFREVFQDVMKKYKAPNVGELQEHVNQRINDNLTRITDGLTNNIKVPQNGVVGDKKDGL